MTSLKLVEQLLALPDVEAQRQFLKERASTLNNQVACNLKEKANHFLRSDIQRSLEIADLVLYMAKMTNDPLDQAVGLWAKANAHSIGLGKYQQALDLFDRAIHIYQTHNCAVEQAAVRVGKVWPLACLGCYEQAVKVGQEAASILETQSEWGLLATLTMNLAAVHGRQGEDNSALRLLDRARELYHRFEIKDPSYLSLIEQNRAIVLRNLGHFSESIEASQTAWEQLTRAGQLVEAARAQQNLAITYFVLGQYNEALRLLNEVKDVFIEDGRKRDAVLVELFISDCFLQLCRFDDVLEKCLQVREHFAELGTRFEVAQTILNEAIAYAGLHQYDEALISLSEAKRAFSEEGNDVYAAVTDLERAAILLRQGALEESRSTIKACIGIFQKHDLPVKAACAQLLAARVAILLDQSDRATELTHRALEFGTDQDIPTILYQCHRLLGTIFQTRNDPRAALAEYEQAATELERLRGRLMIEFRIEFTEDKCAVYEDIVCLCLDTAQPLKGLEYVERAKSRTLLDLLAHRLDLSIQARNEQDIPLIEELVALRARRDQIYRRWEIGEEAEVRGGQQEVQQEVLTLEKQITELWHRLLIQNADYARDAALWHVRTEPVQSYLNGDTVILEYFVAHEKLIVFLITTDSIEAHCLPGEFVHIQQLAQFLWLNLKAVPQCYPGQMPHLAQNAYSLLQQLYECLLSPVSEKIASYQNLVVAPYGFLHYVPFHALYNGQDFLIERHEISYIPGASLLRYCRETKPSTRGMIAFGYSCDGRLPYTVQEASSVAATFNGEAFLESDATLARLRKVAGNCRILHLATHGDFRADNPLFSGLSLDDGWLTTWDIFNLRLNASLVTLSACQTGRSIVRGGDELLGLTRAFLYAGTASLVLSLWSVEDLSAAQVMEGFYRNLAKGWMKGAALKDAQLQAIRDQRADHGACIHPYFWASFFLVGNSGHL